MRKSLIRKFGRRAVPRGVLGELNTKLLRTKLLGSTLIGILAFALPLTSWSQQDNVSQYGGQNYQYGCTQYKPFMHCDPISHEFKSHAELVSYTKVGSATRQPDFAKAHYGTGLVMSSHNSESLKVNKVQDFKTANFTLYLSFIPEALTNNSPSSPGHLITFTNGIFDTDNHTAGWQLVLLPNNSSKTWLVKFSVFNTKGVAYSPKEISIGPDSSSDIAASFDGRQVRMYINGSLDGQASFSGDYSADPGSNATLKIGGDAYVSGYPVSGIFDEIRLYNSVLSPEKVHAINSNADSSDTSLVADWKFDGDLRDSSGHGNDGYYVTLISSMSFAPDGRLFYNEKDSGRIRVMQNGSLLEQPFAIIPNIHVDFEQGLLGLALDSKFEQNHFVYADYNFYDNSTGNIYSRVVRFTDVNNVGQNETILLDKIPASYLGFHSGGALAFNPTDDKLYITVGDTLQNDLAQNHTSLNGKVLRINRDGSVPSDNPYTVPAISSASATSAPLQQLLGFLKSIPCYVSQCPPPPQQPTPVFNIGHRNMFGIAFDPNGHGIVTEPGSDAYDEVNTVEKGANYGWDKMQPPNTPPELFANTSSVIPLRSFYQVMTPTQVIYYDGDKFPELKGTFIFGTFRGDLYSMRLDSNGSMLIEEEKLIATKYPQSEVVSIAASPSGDIYFGGYDIYKLGSIDNSSNVQTMYPFGVDTQGAKLSALGFDKSSQKISIDLANFSSPKTLTLKIPTEAISIFKYSQNGTTSVIQGVDLNGKSQVAQLQARVQQFQNFSIVSVDIRSSTEKIQNLRVVITPNNVTATSV